MACGGSESVVSLLAGDLGLAGLQFSFYFRGGERTGREGAGEGKGLAQG